MPLPYGPQAVGQSAQPIPLPHVGGCLYKLAKSVRSMSEIMQGEAETTGERRGQRASPRGLAETVGETLTFTDHGIGREQHQRSNIHLCQRGKGGPDGIWATMHLMTPGERELIIVMLLTV